MKAKINNQLDKRYNADNIDYKHAFNWFDRRRTEYLKLVKRCAPYINKDGCIFDIGGNIGFFSLLLSETTGFTGKIHIFEPIPNLVELCHITCEKIKATTIIHPYGLSNKSLSTTIHLAADGNIGWNTIIKSATSSDMRPIDIDLKAFDNTGIIDIPCFIKIDVEGSEYLVFDGLLDSLKKWKMKPAILCEVGWGNSHPFWEQELAILNELASIGYIFYDANNKVIKAENISESMDVLMLPEKC